MRVHACVWICTCARAYVRRYVRKQMQTCGGKTNG